MYNEYPDLIYEGLISDSFYTDIVEEGLGESIKNGFNKIKNAFKKAIDKLIEKWKWILGKIKDGIKKIKEKFKKNNNTTSSSSTPANVKATVKYKFKIKDYIKDFDDDYEKVSEILDKVIANDIHGISKFYDFENKNDAEYPSSMEDVKEKLLDSSSNESHLIETQEEIDILLSLKPEKYTTIIDKLRKVSETFTSTMDITKGADQYAKTDEQKEALKKSKELFTKCLSHMNYLINYATLILEQVTSLKVNKEEQKESEEQ